MYKDGSPEAEEAHSEASELLKRLRRKLAAAEAAKDYALVRACPVMRKRKHLGLDEADALAEGSR